MSDTPISDTIFKPIIFFPAMIAAITFGTYDAFTPDLSTEGSDNQAQVITQFEQNLEQLTERHNQNEAISGSLYSNAAQNLLNPNAETEQPVKDATLYGDINTWLSALILTSDISEENKDDLLDEFSDNIKDYTEYGFTPEIAYLDECRMQQSENSVIAASQDASKAKLLANKVSSCSTQMIYQELDKHDASSIEDVVVPAATVGTIVMLILAAMMGENVANMSRNTERNIRNGARNLARRRREYKDNNNFNH